MKLSIAIAGTTHRTKQVAENLQKNFNIPWILTPSPRKIGRKQVLTKNPLHEFAQDNKIKTILIDKSINSADQEKIEKLPKPDFLLVVDFGFLVPKWLLELPKQHPLNIHPSLLPEWRGSSPAQFALMSGQKQSAVTIMIMNEKLDQGPILEQVIFDIKPNWTQNEYYQHSFDLASAVLDKVIKDLTNGELKPQPQSEPSPTPTAKRLSKEDSFIEWSLLENAMESTNKTNSEAKFGPLNLPATPENISNACRGFYPWPKLWTFAPDSSKKTNKRMIIHSCHVEKTTKSTAKKLVLDKTQLEGQKPKKYSKKQ